jgi:hypothetical protein
MTWTSSFMSIVPTLASCASVALMSVSWALFRKTSVDLRAGDAVKRDLWACLSRPVEARVKPRGCRVTGTR